MIYEWRGGFTNDEANELHAAAFATRMFTAEEWDWVSLSAVHSLGWVVARDAGRLVDFDDDLKRFYFDACAFTPTNGGLIALQ